MLDLFFILLSFLATFLTTLLAVGVLWAWRRFTPTAADERGPESGSPSLLKVETLSTISAWDKLLGRFDFVEAMQQLLARAAVDWSVGRVTALMLLCGSVGAAILLNVPRIPAWAAMSGTLGASALPLVYLKRLGQRRTNEFQAQFPDALDSLCNSLRAGQPLLAGIYTVAQEHGPPLGAEFRRVFEECKLGLSLGQALDHLSERLPLPDVVLFAAAVQLQSRTGGNLAEVLTRLAESVREAGALQGEVRAIAAHGKLTGLVLTLLPLVIVALLLAMNPDYFTGLLRHRYGPTLIAAAVGCLILARVVIRRIVDVQS